MSNYQCPKCKYASGDSWGQCRKDCPMPMSPYYRKETEEKYRAGIVQITGKLGKALSDAQMQAALGCGDIVAELGDGTRTHGDSIRDQYRLDAGGTAT